MDTRKITYKEMERKTGEHKVAEENKFILQDPNYSLDLLQKLNSLRSEPLFSDAIVCVGQEEFPCHRNVLAVSSPYFKAMFTSDLRESKEIRVFFNEVSPWTLKRVIEFVYTGRLEITPENAQEMLAAGSLFEYPAIVEASCEFLRRQLHPSNCLGIENFAQVHSCTNLQEDAHKFAIENFSLVVEYDEFLDLLADQLVVYISSDLIDVRTEEIVYESVMRWIKFDLEERQCFLYKLLEQVRLPIVDIHNLQAMEKDPLIRSHDGCLLLVQEAQEHHESIHDQHGKRRRSMQTTQVHPRPSTVAKEVIVVVGGCNSYVTRTVEMYDAQKDKWMSLPDFPKAVTWYGVCTLTNSIIVTGGNLDGHIIANTWKFDTVKRIWVEITAMLKPRARHATSVLNDCLYVLGGISYDDSGYTLIDADTIECYDPVLKTWTVVGHSPFPRKQSHMVPFQNTLVEVGGLQGEVKVNTMDSYLCVEPGVKVHPTGEQFILPEPIQYAQLVVLHRIFYIIWEDSKKFIALNPQKRTFHRLPDMHNAHKHSCTTVLGDNIYISGGLVDARPSTIVERFNVTTNTWTIEKPMMEARAFHGCVTVQM